MRQAGFLRDAAIAATVLAVLLAVPVVLPSKAILDFGIRGAAMALFATSLNLLVGYTGLVSFGHGMFYGLGTYAFALLMQRTAFSLPLAFLATLGITALTAAAVGAICIRLRTIYFAFVTLAMQMLLYSVIISWVDLTGGDQGMMGGIPRRVVGRVDFGDHATLYAASCIALMLGMLLMRHIVASPFGASLRMIRDNEPRAAFLGITVWRMKLSIFVLSSVFAATGGVIVSLYLSGAYPTQVNWPISGDAIFAIMLGGINSFLGPVVGTVILQLLNDLVTRQTEYHGLVLGAIILLFAVGLRRGVMDFNWRARGRGA
ncbi:MAG TPA: branched-chain amino acid ABC transporter permease [Acetobacteraceae bacterium]|jgi:branched-chain amino acid transport system permease protein